MLDGASQIRSRSRFESQLSHLLHYFDFVPQTRSHVPASVAELTHHSEKTMNKADLTEQLSARGDIPKVRAAKYINIIVTSIQEALLAGEKVTISDFGTFTVSQRREFTGHNPKNGSEIRVPKRRIPVFRAGKGLKVALNDVA